MLRTELLLQLLDICDRCYDHADIVAGIDGRDGAIVTTLPTGETVLAFRGTMVDHTFTSILDWINDLHADLVPAEGLLGRVHAGFLASLNALWPAAFDALEGVPHREKPAPMLMHPANPAPWWKRLLGIDDESAALLPMPETSLPWKKNLLITGHSKGGALAQLAGVRLAALNPTVVTFASPLVGDLDFASRYPAGMLTRYEGTSDAVPFLPPLGYRAAGELIAEDGNMPKFLRRLHIDQLIAQGELEKVRQAHSTTSYRAWLNQKPPPAAAEVRKAA